MAYSLISAVSATAPGLNSDATTGSIDTTGATLITVVGVCLDLNALALIDNKSNSPYTSAATYDVGSLRTQIFYFVNPTVGSGHTWTLTNNRAKDISVAAWSGSATSSPLDQTSAGGNNGGSSTTYTTGSITPAQDNELVIIGLQTEGTDTPPFSVGSGFTSATAVTGVAGTAFGSALWYLIQTTAAASNPTVTIATGSNNAQGIQASFKASGGGGGGDQPMMRRWGGFQPVQGIGQSSGGGKGWG